MKSELSIIIPIWNEKENLPELIRRLHRVSGSLNMDHEIILVDDGSQDGSPELIHEACEQYGNIFKGVFLTSNMGQHPAIIRGMEQSIGKYVITLDADLQNPPEEIPHVLEQLQAGHDVVGTIRRNRQDNLFRRWASNTVNRFVKNMTGRWEMNDYGCMLRGYERRIVNDILSSPLRERFIPLLAMSFSKNPTEILVNHAPRTAGDSKYGFWDLVKLCSNLMAVGREIKKHTS